MSSSKPTVAWAPVLMPPLSLHGQHTADLHLLGFVSINHAALHPGFLKPPAHSALRFLSVTRSCVSAHTCDSFFPSLSLLRIETWTGLHENAPLSRAVLFFIALCPVQGCLAFAAYITFPFAHWQQPVTLISSCLANFISSTSWPPLSTIILFLRQCVWYSMFIPKTGKSVRKSLGCTFFWMQRLQIMLTRMAESANRCDRS